MINGLDIYYSKNIGRGLRPVSNNNNNNNNNKQQTISTEGRGLKPISKGGSCKKVGAGLKILQ